MGDHSQFDDDAAPVDDDADRAADGPAATRAGIVAHVERYDHGPDECTLFPLAVDADELVTRWITAEEGSYVPLAGTR